ncbi:unnamed protein product [Effrenium voratum]|nr:unnamed protein product [Effrenium voratum]
MSRFLNTGELAIGITFLPCGRTQRHKSPTRFRLSCQTFQEREDLRPDRTDPTIPKHRPVPVGCLRGISLLDSVKAWDILQAHLRFERCPEIVSEMPCRARSADWETSGRLKEYSTRSGTPQPAQPAQPEALGPWRLKLPGKRHLTADVVTISVATSPGQSLKLWAHLKNFVDRPAV